MEPDERPVGGIGVLLLVMTLVMVAVTGLQAVALFDQSDNLDKLRTAQTSTIEQSKKVRAQLDALASKTAKLADQGNADAKTIVVDLKRQGITIKPAS